MTAIKDRMRLAGSQVREQKADMKADRVDKRNRRLMEQTEALRAELERERDARQELHDLMESGSGRRRGGLLRIVVVGGAAYLLGAKAGRGRYEQIMQRFARIKDTARRRVTETAEDASQALETATAKAANAPSNAVDRS